MDYEDFLLLPMGESLVAIQHRMNSCFNDCIQLSKGPDTKLMVPREASMKRKAQHQVFPLEDRMGQTLSPGNVRNGSNPGVYRACMLGNG